MTRCGIYEPQNKDYMNIFKKELKQSRFSTHNMPTEYDTQLGCKMGRFKSFILLFLSRSFGNRRLASQFWEEHTSMLGQTTLLFFLKQDKTARAIEVFAIITAGDIRGQVGDIKQALIFSE